MAEKICGIVTETMMYRVGHPLPLPAGYAIEPFLVVGIVMVEQTSPAQEGAGQESKDEVEQVDPVVDYLVFAVPDWNELWDANGDPKPMLPEECPEQQKAVDPNWEINWPNAVRYNRDAHEHEAHKRRLVITVSADVVVRTERLVDEDEFQQLVRDFKNAETTTEGEPAGEPADQQVGEKTQVVQPDAGGAPNA